MTANEKSGPAPARKVAFDALWRVEARDDHAETALDELLTRLQPRPEDRALAYELTYGVIRWRLLLDHYLAQVLDRPLEQVERKTRIALQLGAYQLLHLERIPPRAAVNESVSLAPPPARGFVNAVLRALARRLPELAGPDRIADPAERLAVSESHPRWMVELWTGMIGREDTALVLRANNLRPALGLRVNTLRATREELLSLLAGQGVEARPGELSPLAVLVSEPGPVRLLPGYAEGLFAVQDEASQLVPLILDPRPGNMVLDACAAPGTKSLAIAQLLAGRGTVAAVDVNADRLRLLAAESKRLGMENVTPVVADVSAAGELPAPFDGAVFDRVLVDAPCTGLGTMRRRPEIKWRRTPEDLARMASRQRAILERAAARVKPGGVVVYSTCTLTREENEEVVEPLLASGEYELLEPAPPPGAAGLVEGRMVRTWPHRSWADGFTVFKLRRRD